MIKWKKDKSPYSNGEWGYKNKIRCFYIGWAVTTKDQKAKPYLVTCYLPSIKLLTTRFWNTEEAKKECEWILGVFIRELTKE